MSHFERDLNKEKLLGKFLDGIYESLNLEFERIEDISLQQQGIDLIYLQNETILIDEKAQLDYLNKSLPTFTFELSYLKNDAQKIGWLLDNNKKTTHYFLITGIYTNEKSDLSKGFKSCVITSVNRKKLMKHLQSKGLDKTRLLQYDSDLRDFEVKTIKNPIAEINFKTEGLLYFLPQLAEKPINLQLRLKYLLKIGVAKQIYP